MEITKRQVWIALALIASLVLIPFVSSKVIAASGLDDDVKLLLHGNVGDDIVTTLRDSSFSGHTVTLNGDAKRATDKFSQSGFFDGSGDYLSAADNSDFNFGSGNFTIDFWVRFNSSANAELISKRGNSDVAWLILSVVSGTGTYYISSNGSSWDIASARTFGSFSTNTWYHIALVRNGTTFTVYKDGAAVDTFTSSSSVHNDTNSLLIGKSQVGAGGDMNGSIDELRISKGVARWTSAFTPPTAPYTSDANTSLLLHMDGTPPSTTFTDSSGSPKTVTATGNAVISSLSKFGGDGIYFDGSGDYLSIPHSTDFAFGSGDFTIDFWVRPQNTTTQDNLMSKRANNSVWAPFIIAKGNGIGNNAIYTLYSSSNGSSGDIANALSFGNVVVNKWQHIAISRSGNTIYLFVDGVLGNTINTSASLMSNSDSVRIGAESNGLPFLGGMDEIRISKGVARWTANFTPPTEAYGLGPAINLTGNVKFLRNIAVIGSLSKGVGTFVIDHPQKPRTHLLSHSFVESPDVKNLYDGIAKLDENGEVVIELPGYFEALNKDFRYQYFPLDEAMPNLHVKEKVKNNRFIIAGGKPGGRVSWQITGIRHDPYIEANPIRVEVEKGPDELVDKGECLHQEACQ